MNLSRIVCTVLVVAFAAMSPQDASATMLLRLDLEELTERADLIFRGTVVDVVPGAVEAGGGSLPTVTYRFKVGEIVKGAEQSFVWKGEEAYAEVTMIGDVKGGGESDAQVAVSPLPEIPAMKVGGEYLLFTTPESSIGLSSPVGLGQGLFEITTSEKQAFAKNAYNNVGLLGTSEESGAITYERLTSEINRTMRDDRPSRRNKR